MKITFDIKKYLVNINSQNPRSKKRLSFVERATKHIHKAPRGRAGKDNTSIEVDKILYGA